MNIPPIIRGTLKYLILGPCHWILTVLSYIIVPFLVPFASKDGWLPKWCWYFQTWDNTLDGDHGWQTEHRPWLDKPYEEFSWFQKYISRILWLYRNPVYGFEKSILCAVIQPFSKRTIYGNIDIGGYPFKANKAFVVIENVEGKAYCEFAGAIRLTDKKQLNWMIGWKLIMAQDPNSRVDNYVAQICSTIRINDYKKPE